MATRRTRFTLLHGFAASLAVHSAVALPFVLHPLAVNDDSAAVVIDFQGIVSDQQTTQQDLQETGSAAQRAEEAQQKKTARDPLNTKADAPPIQHAENTEHAQLDTKPDVRPPPTPQQQQTTPVTGSDPVAENDQGSPPPPAEQAPSQSAPPAEQPRTQAAAPEPSRSGPAAEITSSVPAGNSSAPAASGARSVKGADEERDAQTMKAARAAEDDRIRDYAHGLSKSIQTHLVYPDEGRRSDMHGTATVSFTILTNGQIRADSLKVVQSSGQAKLDASALKTIRASVPFAPPPEEMTIAIDVDFVKFK